MQQALHNDLTPGGAVALLVFFAFAMQCMSTMAVVRRETGGWRWPAVQFAYMTVLAYVCALVTNRSGPLRHLLPSPRCTASSLASTVS